MVRNDIKRFCIKRNAKRIYYVVQSRVDDVLVKEFGVEEEDNYAALKSKRILLRKE